jgi:hypothetical protein
VEATGYNRPEDSTWADNTAFVYDYVKPGLNAPSDADFEMPDNLALDKAGNLFIAEDPGGNFPHQDQGR